MSAETRVQGVHRAAAMLRSIPPALALVLVVAIALRVALCLSYRPAALVFADSVPFVDMADAGLFSDPARPAGYSMGLRVLHAVSADLDVTIAAQHLIGLATGLLIYAVVRRLGAPLWAALAAAAAVLLSLDQIYLEHTIASEALFAFVFAAVIYAGVRALDDPRRLIGALNTRHVWLLVASGLLGLSAWVRGVSMLIVPFFALWALFAIPGRWRGRLLNATFAAVPALATVLVYFALNSAATGTFGLVQMSGWGLYSRVAPFADCAQFTPPEGTERLCESTPAAERPGPDFYSWQKDSPAQRLFGYPPAGDEELGEFGRAAMLGQPISYVGAVTDDFIRYFTPSPKISRLYGGVDYTYLDIEHRVEPATERQIVGFVNGYYPDASAIEIGSVAERLNDLQQLFRVHSMLLLQATILALLGAVYARGRVRAGILLTGGGALLIILISSTVTYNARYAIPADGPLIAAAALGLWVLLERFARRRATATSPS